RPPSGKSIFRPQTSPLMAAVLVDDADRVPPILPCDPPSPTWWPLEESLVARGSLPIYTFVSQFAGDCESALLDGDGNDDQSREAPSPEQVDADVRFLRRLHVEGLLANGAYDAPLWRVMVSPAATLAGRRRKHGRGKKRGRGKKKRRYYEHKLPTPATLVADLQATANFKSAIANMNDDGSNAPLPYLGYGVFRCADEVHEDDEKQYIFATSEDLAEAIAEAESEVVDPAADEGDMGAGAYHENTLQSRAQLASLKQYVLKQRVFYVLIHTDRRRDVKLADQDKSSDVLLLALGVSPATGNLVGVIAIQTCHNLCD
ncbi:unnamed protein product, partial [Ectocarpus fasciculatus]